MVGHDAIGAERQEPRRLVGIVDRPEVDAQADAVALGDERRAIEPDPTGVDRDLRRGAGERQLAPQHRRQGEQARDLGLRERGLTTVAAAPDVEQRGELEAGQGDAVYKRGNVLIAANAKDVDVEKDEAKLKKIKRFSEEYFKLVKANTASENAILAQQAEGEELIVKLRGEVYCVK